MSPCKEYEGYRDRYGYGRRGRVLIHREAWEQAHGPIPDGLCVLHRCDNPPCYRVDHLYLGTRTDNARDRQRKGRTVGPPVKTHCVNGHPITDVGPRGGKRRCLVCHAEQQYRRNHG